MSDRSTAGRSALAALAALALVLGGSATASAQNPSELAFDDDFESGSASAWTATAGSWGVTTTDTGVYSTTTTAGEARAVAGSSAWTDYTVEAQVRIDAVGTQPAAGLLARYVDASNFYVFRLQEDQQKVKMYRVVAGTWTLLGEAPATIVVGTWYDLAFRLDGSSLTGWLDGQLVVGPVTDTSFSSGSIGLRSFGAAFAIDDLVVNDGATTLLAQSFDSGAAAGWSAVVGTWAVGSEDTTVYRTTTTAGEARSGAGSLTWEDYAVEAHVRIDSIGTAPASGIIGRYDGANDFYILRLQHDQQKVKMYRVVAGVWTLLDDLPFTIDVDQWYELRLVMDGGQISGYVDGTLAVGPVTDTALDAGAIGLRTYGAATSFDGVRVIALSEVAAPTGLAADATTPSSIRLTWTDVDPTADAYAVYRKKTSESTWLFMGQVAPGVQSFESGGLFQSTSYDHRVVAIRAGAEGGSTAVVAETTPATGTTPHGVELNPIGVGNSRNSEGDTYVRADGTIVHVYGRYVVSFPEVGTDIKLYQVVSTDDGATWSSPAEVFPGYARGMLQVSLERLPSGDLGMTYTSWASSSDSRKVFRTSSDDGATWSSEVDITSAALDYSTGANDRLRVLADGRLVQVAHTTDFGAALRVTVFTSDDGGATWTLRTPTGLQANGQAMWEADVVEYAPDALLMYARTSQGWIFESRSTDGGSTWSTPVRTQIRYNECPVKLFALPGEDAIALVACGLSYVPGVGFSNGGRHALASLISDDGGVTWQNYRQIEYTSNTMWHHYPSVTVADGIVHLAYTRSPEWEHGPTYYQGLPVGWFTDTGAWPY